MTRRYTATKDKGEAANAVGHAMLEAQTVRKSAQVAAREGNHG